MLSHFQFHRRAGAAIAVLGLIFGACVHTPPGTSVNVALAKRAELLRPVAPPPSAVARVAPVEPELPKDSHLEKVADAFSRGSFCMQAGKDPEAISAFEEAVKFDPAFSEAWQNLAILYEKIGDEKKALEAFRRAKKLARQ